MSGTAACTTLGISAPLLVWFRNSRETQRLPNPCSEREVLMSPFPTPQHHPSLLSLDTETTHGAVEVIHARGAIDLLTGPELERCIEVALGKAPSAIVVDMTDVDFLASFGMSILLRTNDRLTQDTPLVVVADGPAT